MKNALFFISLTLLAPLTYADSGFSSTVEQQFLELKMDENQRKEVDQIEQKYAPKIKAQRDEVSQAKSELKTAHKGAPTGSQDVMNKTKALQSAENDLEQLFIQREREIFAVLTPEQQTELKKKKAKKQKRRKNRKEFFNDVFSTD